MAEIASTITTGPKNIWVVRHHSGWAVRVEGDSNPIFFYRTQALAMARGLILARKRRCELIVQNRQRRIREKNSYGNDPHPPKG